MVSKLDRIVVWDGPLDREKLARVGEVRPDGWHNVYKPAGLWYAFGWEWVEWCRQENFHDGQLRRAYRVGVEEGRILSLSTEAELVEFTKKYTADPPYAHLRSPAFPAPETFGLYVDWARLRREEYAGIEIPVYQWRWRLRLLWYYGWDVASGCVWDPAAITSLEEVEIPAAIDDNEESETG